MRKELKEIPFEQARAFERQYVAKCQCSNKIAFHKGCEKLTCNWCGRTVYSPQYQFRTKLMEELKNGLLGKKL